jgi:hypothetical protein
MYTLKQFHGQFNHQCIPWWFLVISLQIGSWVAKWSTSGCFRLSTSRRTPREVALEIVIRRLRFGGGVSPEENQPSSAAAGGRHRDGGGRDQARGEVHQGGSSPASSRLSPAPSDAWPAPS